MRANHKHYNPTALRDAEITLFDPPAQPVDTSLEAAARIRPHTARVREAIFLWLKTQGARGATCGEIEAALGLSGNTVRPRLRELQGHPSWAPDLPARIERLTERRAGMRVYRTL